MKVVALNVLAVTVMGFTSSQSVLAQPKTLEAALSRGDASGSFNLRYESVSEDNALKDASALTLRSALKYTTGTLKGFTGVLEMEDVRIVGLGDYSVPPSGYKTGQYSVIADPENTEVNQSYLQYMSGGFTGRIGRQDLRYDNQRFIGAVPWRQDYQSFDALSLEYRKDAAQTYTLNYNYLTKRERIFGQDADIDSKDHVLHGTVKLPVGQLTGYAYLLEDDIALNNSLDTWGVRLTGNKTVSGKALTYLAEYATQDYERGTASYDTDYYVLEGGITLGKLTAKLGYESLGSDQGAYGFSTPLATGHAFQGWADQFLATPAQGINDTYLNLAGAVAGGNAMFVYHDFSADHSTATVDDLGNEVNVQWTRGFRTNYTFGIKYADYSKGDLAAKADKQVFWTWVTLTF